MLPRFDAPRALSARLSPVGADQVQIAFEDERGVNLLERQANLTDLRALGLQERLSVSPYHLDQTLGGAKGLELGNQLASWLFGPEKHQAELFGRLFGLSLARCPNPNPLIGAARLRVHTTVSELLAQPWMMLSWRGIPLLSDDWIVLVDPGLREPTFLEIRWPPRVLLVVSKLELPSAEAHERDLRSLLGRSALDGELLKTVSTLPDLIAACARPWDLIYIYGHGGQREGEATLRMQGERGPVDVPLLDLRVHLKRAEPQLIYINACMVGAGGWFGAGNILGAVAPVVLSHHSAVRVDSASARAREFMRKFVEEGADAIDAFHEKPSADSVRRYEWLCGAAVSSVSGLKVCERSGVAGPPPDPLWAWRVDRSPQKYEVAGELAGSAKDWRRGLKSLSFLAVGAPGAGLVRATDDDPTLGAVLCDHAQDSTRAAVLRVAVPPPVGAVAVGQPSWGDVLREALGAPPGCKLSAALANFLRERGLGREEPVVLWFDFGGVLWSDTARSPFKVTDWSRQCLLWARELDSRETALRLVFYLGVECDAAWQKRLAEALAGLKPELNTVDFTSIQLPITCPVTGGDLEKFLRNWVEDVQPKVLDALASRLAARAAGAIDYRDAVRTLERGHQLGWHALLEELGGPTSHTPTSEI